MDTLEAVNELLESIGQTPVSSLENVGLGDVNTAQSLLMRVARAVQLHGFDFNTDDDYELTPDADGLILVPEGVLRIDPMDKNSALKRRRHPNGQWAIWNTPEQSWVHTDPVTFRIIWAYPFEDMPDSARHYVALSAARKFQKRIIGSDTLDGYNADDENRAWLALSRDERANRDTNLFSRNPILAGQVSNRRY